MLILILVLVRSLKVGLVSGALDNRDGGEVEVGRTANVTKELRSVLATTDRTPLLSEDGSLCRQSSIDSPAEVSDTAIESPPEHDAGLLDVASCEDTRSELLVESVA